MLTSSENVLRLPEIVYPRVFAYGFIAVVLFFGFSGHCVCVCVCVAGCLSYHFCWTGWQPSTPATGVSLLVRQWRALAGRCIRATEDYIQLALNKPFALFSVETCVCVCGYDCVPMNTEGQKKKRSKRNVIQRKMEISVLLHSSTKSGQLVAAPPMEHRSCRSFLVFFFLRRNRAQ